MIRVDNLYTHADGGRYCLLTPESPMKHPVSGEWVSGVIYVGPDGLMRSTTRARWDDRFAPVAEVSEDELSEAELRMIRRANPGNNSGFDFVQVMESWHESEIGITGHMLELAVGAAVQKYEWPGHLVDAPTRFGPDGNPDSVEVTITTEDLQRVVQNYEIERVPEAHGFTFVMRKSFPDEG